MATATLVVLSASDGGVIGAHAEEVAVSHRAAGGLDLLKVSTKLTRLTRS